MPCQLPIDLPRTVISNGISWHNFNCVSMWWVSMSMCVCLFLSVQMRSLDLRRKQNFIHWPETSSIKWSGSSNDPRRPSTGAIAICLANLQRPNIIATTTATTMTTSTTTTAATMKKTTSIDYAPDTKTFPLNTYISYPSLPAPIKTH